MNSNNTNLTNVVLTSANLTNVNLSGSTLTNANLSGTTLIGLITGSIIGTPLNIPTNYRLLSGFIVGPSVNLTNKDLSNINLSNINLNNSKLISANLTNVVLTGSTLTSVDLSNTILIDLITGNIVGIPINIPNNYKLLNGYIIGPSVKLINSNCKIS